MTETTGTPRKNSSKKEKATSKSPSRSNSNRKEVEDEKLRQGLTPPPKKPILKSGSLSSKQTSNEPAKAVKPQVKEKRQNEESNAATESPNGDKIVVGENFPMLAEELQVMLTRGEHLTRRPVGLLLLLAVELIVCTATLIVWSTMGDNPPLPMILAIFNLLLIFVILVGIICVEFMRFQVREASVNRNESRYTIPYAWKIALFSMHVFRIWLISANLTIAIVDNKYDPGSVTMMAVQPLMLLICLVHVIFVLRPHHDR